MNLNGPSKNLSENKNDMQIVAMYEAILATTHQMLQATKDRDWDRLIVLECDCKQLTNRLTEQHPTQPLNKIQQKKKINLIQQILACDAEIRIITEPQIAYLQNMLTSYEHKRKLKKTYQAD
jgi:flagellar protein FliT